MLLGISGFVIIALLMYFLLKGKAIPMTLFVVLPILAAFINGYDINPVEHQHDVIKRHTKYGSTPDVGQHRLEVDDVHQQLVTVLMFIELIDRNLFHLCCNLPFLTAKILKN